MNNIKLIEQALDILNLAEGYTEDEEIIEVMDILEDIRSNLVEDPPIEDILASLPYLYSKDDDISNVEITNDKTKYTPYLTKYGDTWYVEWMDTHFKVLLSFSGNTAREALENASYSIENGTLKKRNK